MLPYLPGHLRSPTMSPQRPQRDNLSMAVSRSSLSLKRIETIRLIIHLGPFFAVAPRLGTHRLQWLPLPLPRFLYFRITTSRTPCSKHPKLRFNRTSTREMYSAVLQPQQSSQRWGSTI